jgi:uncharacterized protein
MSIVIAVMAKDPRRADVKTRLGPCLDQAQRSALYEAFLADKLHAVRSVASGSGAIMFTPASSRSWFETWAGQDIALHAQPEGSLGDRVVAAFATLFRPGVHGVILTDSDTPHLPAAYLQAGVEALAAGRALVLGPADDGGYYLIGLSAPCPQIFADVEWSSSNTLRQTVAGAARCGLTASYLPQWYDIDEPNDLRRLERDILEGASGPCPHTAALLARWQASRQTGQLA